MASKVRLYVDQPLGEGQLVPLSRDQAHYLFGVMRMAVGTVLSLINGRDGEWDAEVADAGKHKGVLVCVSQTKPLQAPPDLWLLFAPIRKERMQFLVEKATELGVAVLQPVQTTFTNHTDRVRIDKMRAHVVEAVEQCGATFVPDVRDPAKLDALLRDWPDDRPLYFCDEAALGEVARFDAVAPSAKAAILIGPEGGFSDDERTQLQSHAMTQTISLGPRILRAETAAVAALTLWQSTWGDWAE
ncbi:MAG: 16S rRNA (uracil(1498)-N(3))-methyltransferase [Pseudomonadota bacterium]